MIRKLSYLLLTIFVAISCTGKKSEEADQDTVSDFIGNVGGEMYMLVGTYTSNEGSKGIYVYKFDTKTAEADSVSMVEVANPSYLAVSMDGEFVYSVGENGEDDSYAHAFSFDRESGQLKLIDSQLTYGSSPAYITLDEGGTNLFTANYGGGSISQFNINRDGALSPLSNLYQFEGSGDRKSTRLNSSHL